METINELKSTTNKKFHADLDNYKLVCSIVANIISLAELHEKDELITVQRFLAMNLISRLEEKERLSENDEMRRTIIPIKASYAKYTKLIYDYDKIIYDRYEQALGSGYVGDELRNINKRYFESIVSRHHIIGSDTLIDLYELFKDDEELLLSFIFSDINVYLRIDMFTKCLIDENSYDYSNFDHVKNALKIKDEAKIKEYEETYDFYIRYISRFTNYGNDIIGNHSRNTEFCLNIMKSGIHMDYYEILSYLYKNYFNHEIVNKVIDCYRKYGRFNEDNYLNLSNCCLSYVGNFEEDVNLFASKSINYFENILKIDFRFNGPFDKDNIKDPLIIAIQKRLLFEIGTLIEHKSSHEEIESYINKIYLMVISKAPTREETAKYIDIANSLVECAYAYIDKYDEYKKAEAYIHAHKAFYI